MSLDDHHSLAPWYPGEHLRMFAGQIFYSSVLKALSTSISSSQGLCGYQSFCVRGCHFLKLTYSQKYITNSGFKGAWQSIMVGSSITYHNGTSKYNLNENCHRNISNLRALHEKVTKNKHLSSTPLDPQPHIQDHSKFMRVD